MAVPVATPASKIDSGCLLHNINVPRGVRTFSWTIGVPPVEDIDTTNRLADLTDISDEELNELAREDLPEWVINPKNNGD